MRTDYQNLDRFEISTVILIFLGLGLTGMVLFSGFNFQQQKHFATVLTIFDLHEQANNQIESIEFVFNATDVFYQQFYNAFTEVTVLPADDISFFQTLGQQTQIALDNISNYSDQFALNYDQLNQPVKPNFAARVAGAMVVNPDYVYHPPNPAGSYWLTSLMKHIPSP